MPSLFIGALYSLEKDIIFSQSLFSFCRLREHKGELRMEVCNECGKKLRPLALKLHMVTEHGKQQVPCPKCRKLFKHRSALPRHFKRAHDECQCEECGKVVLIIKKYQNESSTDTGYS